MPRKPTATKEQIIDGAFRLIRKEGPEALTARNLAAELGCSTQPVMYQFPNLSELKELAYQRADQFHTEYIMSTESLLETGLRYIRFASEETHLFRFLFQSGHFDGANFLDMIRDEEPGGLLSIVAAEMKLPAKDAAPAFEALFIAVHGYASLIANNAIKYDPAAIENTLTSIAAGLLGEDD